MGARAHRVAAAVTLIALAMAGSGAALTLGFAGAGGGRGGNSHRTLPSWIPKQAVQVGRIEEASAAHPWLAIEGDSVLVTLAHGEALATAVGPQVPEIGRVPVPATSLCTFVLTLARTSGTVPLGAGAFTILDEQGHLHHPSVTAYPDGRLPGAAPVGKSFSVKLTGVLPIGQGELRWAPQGTKPIVTWDFDVEID
jgi:hypothetical protein